MFLFCIKWENKRPFYVNIALSFDTLVWKTNSEMHKMKSCHLFIEIRSDGYHWRLKCFWVLSWCFHQTPKLSSWCSLNVESWIVCKEGIFLCENVHFCQLPRAVDSKDLSDLWHEGHFPEHVFKISPLISIVTVKNII